MGEGSLAFLGVITTDSGSHALCLNQFGGDRLEEQPEKHSSTRAHCIEPDCYVSLICCRLYRFDQKKYAFALVFLGVGSVRLVDL